MTLPLAPTPRLSAAATPLVMPPDPPDLEAAERRAWSGAQGERDLLERELLGHAMAHPAGLEQLRRLDPREFSIPINAVVARTIVELADQGAPHDGAAVTAALRAKPVQSIAPPVVTTRARQERFLLDAIDGKDQLGTLIRMDLDRFDPDLRLVAEVIIDREALGLPIDRLSLDEHLADQGIDSLVPRHQRETTHATMLPRELDPQLIQGGRVDPSTVGLGAWQRVSMAAPTRAPLVAAEIRAYHRRDLGMEAATRALRQYSGALELDSSGRLAVDGVGVATKDLADHMVTIPQALSLPTPDPNRSMDLALPTAPALSRAGQAALRRPA